MIFPGNNHELKDIFRNAADPDIYEFNGEYLVDMLTMVPSFRRFSHRKVFYKENGRVSGHNVLFNKIWGHFLMEEGTLDSLKVAVINYDRKENTFLISRIRDYVRCIERDKLYIGRFNYLLFGRLQFLGYFSLEKIK